MLNQEEWLQLCQRLKLSAEGQRVAEGIRASPPMGRMTNPGGSRGLQPRLGAESLDEARGELDVVEKSLPRGK